MYLLSRGWRVWLDSMMDTKAVLDSLSEAAAWQGNGLAQVHRSYIFNPIGRQVYDL